MGTHEFALFLSVLFILFYSFYYILLYSLYSCFHLKL